MAVAQAVLYPFFARWRFLELERLRVDRGVRGGVEEAVVHGGVQRAQRPRLAVLACDLRFARRSPHTISRRLRR